MRIAAIRGIAQPLPLQTERNTAGAALLSMHRDLALPFGFELEIDKGIPLSSGMGGSAASCVAALLAANALLDEPLRREHLYRYALDGEAVASGSRHGDNLGPLFLGGLVLCTFGAPGPGDRTDCLAQLACPSGYLAGNPPCTRGSERAALTARHCHPER